MIDGACPGAPTEELPDPCPDGVPCCDGYAYRGQHACSCWEPIYDREQAEPNLAGEPALRPTMCGDCAFRPGSPERASAEFAEQNADDLQGMVYNPAAVFWCHEGMRAVLGWRHPNGLEVRLPERETQQAYDPLMKLRPGPGGGSDGARIIAHRADGQPAYYCAGLAAARRAAERSEPV